jgi:predicted O-methyltransferase YrrM
MDQATFSAVDDFAAELLAPHDEALQAALKASEDAGLPAIQVSPLQGKLLQLLVRSQGSREVLEFGTLAGYSTIWMARALPPTGRLITLEADAGYAEVAQGNFERAELADLIDLRVGPALGALLALEEEDAGPFDFTFIDADKVNSPNYLAWAVDHTRPGGMIVADNVVREGTLAKGDSGDEKVEAQRRLHEMLGDEPGVTATTIQTVGSKGYDGFTLALVL